MFGKRTKAFDRLCLAVIDLTKEELNDDEENRFNECDSADDVRMDVDQSADLVRGDRLMINPFVANGFSEVWCEDCETVICSGSLQVRRMESGRFAWCCPHCGSEHVSVYQPISTDEEEENRV